MTSAAIAMEEIEKAHPELVDKIGLLFMRHPDAAAFWVAAGEAKGRERARRMFIEGARWPDDNKWTVHDRPTWHTARWAIIAEDAPPEAKAAAEARKGRPAGQAIEALALNYAMLRNPDTTPGERATALCWLLHMVGDIHQPLHVSDQFSKRFPAGNGAGTLEYVRDPLGDSAMPLHILWDSNKFRSTKLEDVDRTAKELRKKYPRTAFPELDVDSGEADFEGWARESFKIAEDFAYGSGIKTVADPDKDLDPDKAVKKMVAYILDGVSPVEDAPEVPEEYWERLQEIAERRITLAGYRLADCIIAAAEQIQAERSLAARAMEAVDN